MPCAEVPRCGAQGRNQSWSLGGGWVEYLSFSCIQLSHRHSFDSFIGFFQQVLQRIAVYVMPSPMLGHSFASECPGLTNNAKA